MTYQLKFKDLAGMIPEERGAEYSTAARELRAPERSGLEALDARIREYELRYEISSEDLLEKLERGEMKETAEIARWLFLLEIRSARVRG